jgi:hypothetical protein
VAEPNQIILDKASQRPVESDPRDATVSSATGAVQDPTATTRLAAVSMHAFTAPDSSTTR